MGGGRSRVAAATCKSGSILRACVEFARPRLLRRGFDRWILIAAAALPLLIFVYRFYDSWRYVTLVEEGLREADKESKV